MPKVSSRVTGGSGSTCGRRPSATPRSRRTGSSSTSSGATLITRVVQGGIDAGEVAPMDVESFAVMWTSLLDGLVVQVALDDPLVTGERAQKIALDVARKELGLA